MQAPNHRGIKYRENWQLNLPLHGLALLAQHLARSLHVKWVQNIALQVWQGLVSADCEGKQVWVKENQSGDLFGSGQPAMNLTWLLT